MSLTVAIGSSSSATALAYAVVGVVALALAWIVALRAVIVVVASGLGGIGSCLWRWCSARLVSALVDSLAGIFQDSGRVIHCEEHVGIGDNDMYLILCLRWRKSELSLWSCHACSSHGAADLAGAAGSRKLVHVALLLTSLCFICNCRSSASDFLVSSASVRLSTDILTLRLAISHFHASALSHATSRHLKRSC